MDSPIRDILVKKFNDVYERNPFVTAYAPGRVEILGNHTDYNEGFVLSAAINFGTFFGVAPRTDDRVRLTAGDLMKTVEFPVGDPAPTKEDSWSNYVKGVIAGLSAHGRVGGFDALFYGNIPLGSGLSSSAALEMSAALAIAKLFELSVPPVELAKIGQTAEREYAGCNCGLLDQASSLFGKKDSLVRSDFRTLSFDTLSIGHDVCFLLFKTHARHALVDGAYNERREACERAAKYFAGVLPHPVTALRDVSWKEWSDHRDGLDPLTARRAAHPIGEDERVLSAAGLLRDRDLEGFGRLMFESHDSSRFNFENSCPELDTIVDAAKATPGVLGARLTGGGFGGSVVALVRPDDAEAVERDIGTAYAAKYGTRCDSRAIVCSDGARVLD